MMMLRPLLLLLLTIGCYGDWDTYSTITGYDWSNSVQIPKEDESSIEIEGKTCDVIQVSALVRHGARYPFSEDVTRIEALRQKLLALNDGPMYANIVSWGSNYTLEDAGRLALQGYNEQLVLGLRTAARFESFLNLMTSAGNLKFISSTKERNIESNKNLIKGFSIKGLQVTRSQNQVEKTLLRMFEGCKNFDDLRNTEECKLYEQTPEFLQVKEKLQTKLGISSLSPDEVYTINDLCAYDKIVYQRVTFWCQLLSNQDRLILEYGNDIKNYYNNSKGNPIIPDMSCPIFNKIFKSMDEAKTLSSAERMKGYPGGIFMDTHATVLLSVMTGLGLFDDQPPLLANNRLSNLHRQFRTSRISPFSANVGLALYNCTGKLDKKQSFNVRLLVNEESREIPGCGQMLCPYETVREKYARLIDNCDIQSVCNDPRPETNERSDKAINPNDATKTTFATTTSYNWTVNVEEPVPNEYYKKKSADEVCKAVHLSMLVRHGARTPYVEDLQRYSNLRQKLLSNPKYQAMMQNPRYTFDTLEAEELVGMGQVEQASLGVRTGLRYKSLLTNKAQFLKFISSNESRNIDSSEWLYRGLSIAVDGLEADGHKPEINTNLLRYHANCPRYDDKICLKESKRYAKTPEFGKVQKKLQNKLGVKDLDADDVYLIHELCAYDIIMNNNRYSPNTYEGPAIWCSLLNDEDRQILDYGLDLKNYYTRSSGHPLIAEMSCGWLSDLFDTLDKAVDYHWDYDNLSHHATDRGYLAGKFMGTHATVLLSVMTSLGLFSDEAPLTADNARNMADRKFRSSKLVPFSANLGVALYACNPTDDVSKRTFKVEFSLNEQPIKLPACESTMCSYSELRKRADGLISRCNVTDVCTNKSHNFFVL